MHVTITGAAGMLGRLLTASLVQAGLGGAPVTRLTLADIAAPAAPQGFDGTVQTLALDIGDADAAVRLSDGQPDVLFHLAAVVSGEAEANFALGYRVNLDGTRQVFDALARGNTCPRVVFASSIAVFGRPFPDRIGDTFHRTPLTSYGTQKAIGELLLSDYSRRGMLDGIALRLPTICIRPGAPNKAASGFFSGILREPLAGLPADLPVDGTVRHWFASPDAAVGFLCHAATLDTAALGADRGLTMPGLTATVDDQIAALERVAGPQATALIRRRSDPAVAAIVAGWPQDFDAARALSLGFVADADFDAILRQHMTRSDPDTA